MGWWWWVGGGGEWDRIEGGGLEDLRLGINKLVGIFVYFIGTYILS